MHNHEFDRSQGGSTQQTDAILSASVFDMMIASADKQSSTQPTTIDRQETQASTENPAETETLSATGSQEKKENVWEKDKPDVVREAAESPTKEEVKEATEKADKLFEDELTKKLYKALVTGHAAGLDMILHDLRHDHGLLPGEGKQKLQKALDELNKVMRYPVQLVTNDKESPPALGLKFKAYHFDGGGKGIFGSGSSEQMEVTMWGFGKYEARTFYTMPTSAANLSADMGEADKRLKTMLVQSMLRAKED